MPQQEPVISSEQHGTDDVADDVAVSGAAAQQTAAPYRAGSDTDAYEAIDDGDWLEEPEQLPRRPRRRLLGKGGNPIAVALLGVLLAACGFIGGVLVEKGEATSSSSSTSASASFAARFRGLTGGSSSSSSSTGGSSALPSGFARPTTGTVAYLEGSTLYVTNSEGNTVKVTTSRGTTVSKSVKASVNGIHPGETVTITGSSGSNGVVSAESISVGSSGGGFAALFGGEGGAGASSSGGGSRSSSSKEPSLFGSG